MEENHQRERETLTGWLPLAHAPTGNHTHNPDMCPDWESNQQPLGLRDNTQPARARIFLIAYISTCCLSPIPVLRRICKLLCKAA